MKKKNLEDIPEADRLAHLKDMSFSKKLEYFWMYDKWVIVLIAGIIFAIWFFVSWYRNSKYYTVLSVYPVNSFIEDTDVPAADIREALSIGDPYAEVLVVPTLFCDPDSGKMDMYSQNSFVSKIAVGAIDFLFMPESMAKGFESDDIFIDAPDLLEGIPEDADAYETDGPFLVIRDEAFLEEYGIAYSPCYVGMILGTEHMDMIRSYVEQVLPAG